MLIEKEIGFQRAMKCIEIDLHGVFSFVLNPFDQKEFCEKDSILEQ